MGPNPPLRKVEPKRIAKTRRLSYEVVKRLCAAKSQNEEPLRNQPLRKVMRSKEPKLGAFLTKL